MLRKLPLIILLIFVLVIPVIHAQGEDSDIAQFFVIDENIPVKKFNDGRIAPIKDVWSLTESQIDRILNEMRLTETEIESLSIEFKRHLVTRGGVKIDLEVETTQYYRSIDGIKYTVTEENKSYIEQIIQNDLNTLQGEVSTQGMGSITDGIFSGTSLLFYLGKTTNGVEFKYDYYTTYTWNGVPQNYYHDNVAHAWQTHTTSVASHGAHNRQPFCTSPEVQQYPYGNNLKKSVSGSQAKFDIYGSGCKQFGTLHDEVRIPVSYNGQTGTFVSSYAHPWLGGINYAILNYLSIDFESFTGNEWTWRNTFTIGQSS